MKKLYLLIALPLILLWSCEKKTENISEVMKVPKITLNGKSTIYLKAPNLVSTWEEIGYVEKGATTDKGQIQIMNNIPKNNIKPGVYYVKYVVVGENILREEKIRKIVVYEDDGVLSGIYIAKSTSSLGDPEFEHEIVISTNKVDDQGNKTYKCDDVFASYFVDFAGGKYAWGGVCPTEDLTIDNSGNILGTSPSLPIVGGGKVFVEGTKIDAENIQWKATSEALSWLYVNVSLEKKKFE